MQALFYVCVLFTVAALRIHPVITTFGTQRKGLTAYVLTQEEMIKKHFPVKGEFTPPSAGGLMCCGGVCFQTDFCSAWSSYPDRNPGL